jgi:hypothetical protein
MTAGALKVEFLVPGATSLKEKRRAVKSLKDRVRHRFNVSVAEIDHQELWRRAALGVAAVGTDGGFVCRVLEEVLAFLRRDRRIQVVCHEIETY